MSSSCLVEQLSGYLDGEVSPKVETQIEEHLTGCPDCRHHLEGLRLVVDRLRTLERVMPPLMVSQSVQQEAKALTGRRYSNRWEGLARLMVFESSVLPFLALVVALGGIALIFASALDRSLAPKSQLIWMGHQPEMVLNNSRSAEERIVGGRVFDRIDGGWAERGVDPQDLPDRKGVSTNAELAVYSELAGRVLIKMRGEVVEVVFEREGEIPTNYSE